MADARVGPVPASHHRRQHREHSRHESLPPQDKKDGLPHRHAGDSPGSAPADSDAGSLFLGNYIFVGGWGSVFCSVKSLAAAGDEFVFRSVRSLAAAAKIVLAHLVFCDKLAYGLVRDHGRLSVEFQRKEPVWSHLPFTM